MEVRRPMASAAVSVGEQPLMVERFLPNADRLPLARLFGQKEPTPSSDQAKLKNVELLTYRVPSRYSRIESNPETVARKFLERKIAVGGFLFQFQQPSLLVPRGIVSMLYLIQR
jgi:hypothetical protein